MKINEESKKRYTITKKGSLGLLAYGDLGFKAWRKIKSKQRK